MTALRDRVRLLVDRRSRGADESGVVVVWMAIMIVVFLGVAAFAIDIAYWHLVQGREQRAADAAALAGAVTYPGDRPTSDLAAKDIAAQNGYSVSSVLPVASTATCPLTTGTTAVCTGAGSEAFQYKVTITQKVDNIFGGIFGLGQTTIRASATAEYLKPLSMGSPSNQFGNDPDNSSWPVDPDDPPQTYPNVWANIEGGGTAKEQGDAYAAGWCSNDASTGQFTTDGCSAVGDGNNLNFTPNGYYYTVDFTDNGSADLQVFDPAFVNVGNFCTTGSANLSGAAQLGAIPGYPQGQNNTIDIHKRFQPPASGNPAANDPGLQYCTGDQSFTNSAGASPLPTTTYRVLKATVPGDPSSAQQVCGPTSFPGYTGDVVPALQNASPLAGAPAPFAKYFRQWYSLCNVNGQTGDEYFIQVQTNNGAGSNHFSLRGVTSGNSAAPVNIAGNTYMSLYANVGGNHTKFYLARVPTAAAGHTLVLNFYDIGDANNGVTGTLQVLPPPDSNVGPTFGDCTYTGTVNSAIGYLPNSKVSPWGPASDLPNCMVQGVNNPRANWNSQWSTVTVKIPSNYTCNDDDASGCWLRIDYLFSQAGVHDVTSWNAFLLGDPVRLVQ